MDDLLHGIMAATLASSASLVVVALLRRPLRAAAGARAAYWLWSLVPPSSIAALLGALLPPPLPRLPTPPAHHYIGDALLHITSAQLPRVTALHENAGVAIWILGCFGMAACMAWRQREFLRSLRPLTVEDDGMARSRCVVAPLVLGAWHPTIVLPWDFESRYAERERAVMLAHERAHVARRDAWSNLVASAWLCLFWFNPLMYWALGRMRIDQELACDASVLDQGGVSRRIYAAALKQAHDAAQSPRPVACACHWRSRHTLTERVAQIARPTPAPWRRVTGALAALTLCTGGAYCAWAAPTVTAAHGRPILVIIKLTVLGPGGKHSFSESARAWQSSGEPAVYAAGKPFDGTPFDVRCTAFLPPNDVTVPRHDPHEASDPPKASDRRRASERPRLAAGQVLLECMVRHDGAVVATPAVITRDGEPATIEFGDGERGGRYEIELRASTRDMPTGAG